MFVVAIRQAPVSSDHSSNHWMHQVAIRSSVNISPMMGEVQKLMH
jgi:hypothetical protein